MGSEPPDAEFGALVFPMVAVWTAREIDPLIDRHGPLRPGYSRESSELEILAAWRDAGRPIGWITTHIDFMKGVVRRHIHDFFGVEIARG